MRESFDDILVGALVNVTARLADVAPKLSALGLFVGLGAMAAWAVAGVAHAALRAAGFDRAADRSGLRRVIQAGGIRRSPAEALAGALGAAIFALAALLALDAVEVPGATSVTGMILGFLPLVLGGALLIILGFLGSRLAAFGARVAWARCGSSRADLAGQVAAWIVGAVACGLALALVGVPPLALLIALAIPLGVIFLGATLGIAQVARDLAQRAAARWVRAPSPPAQVTSPQPAHPEIPAAAGAPPRTRFTSDVTALPHEHQPAS